MAAHDDKISTNRRRLFKALSAAPVVMTLRPGSALANNSAFQCMANIRTNLVLEPGPVAVGDDETFVRTTLLHCVFTETSRVVNPSNGNFRGLGGTGITTTDLAGGVTVVARGDPSDVDGGPFYYLDGTLVSSQFTDNLNNGTFDVRIYLEGGFIKVVNQAGNVCLQEAAVPADFAVVVASVEDGGTEDRRYELKGVYPEVQVVPAGGSAGENQGITATCMASVPMVAARRQSTLSIG